MSRNMLPAVLLVILTFSALGNAQNLYGRIEGTVVDKEGVVVPGVTVTAQNLGTGVIRTTITNDEGEYKLPVLTPGRYSISATRGAEQFGARQIDLSTGDILAVGFGADETVTINSEAAIVDPSKTSVGRVVSSREVENTPLVSRNILNLSPLQPGGNARRVAGPGEIDLSVAGLSRRVAYEIDGISNNHFFRSGFRLALLSETAIQEVQLMSTGYAAEYGGTAGGIVNLITKSGTNDLTGSASVLYRPSGFSAKPFAFAPGTDPNVSAYGFTATLGGPVVKDRWHYFVSSEWTRRHYVIPVTISATDRDQLVALGLPPSIFVNRHSTSDTYPYVAFRTDATIDRSTRLGLRYNYFFSDLKRSGPGGILTTDRSFGFSGPNYALSVEAVTTFSANLLSEFRFQDSRYTLRTLGDERSGTGPTVTITNVAAFGPDPTIGQIAPSEQTVQFQENFTQISGGHTIKFGAGVNFIADRQLGPMVSQYTFQNIAAYAAAVTDVNRKSYSRYQGSVGINNVPDNAIYYNAFLQDEWSFGGSTTLAIGVRYEYFDPPSGDPSAPLAISRTFNSDTNNFAPRMGLAYRIRGGKYMTIARGSSGVYYDPPLLVMYRRALLNDGNPRYAMFTLSGAPQSNWPDFPNTIASDLFPPDLDTVAPDFKAMYAIRSSVQVQQAISRDTSITLGYINSIARHIPVYRNMNCLPTGQTLADGRPVYGTSARPCVNKVYSQFNIVKIAESGGNQNYNGIFVQLTKKSFSDGFQFNVNYTISNSIDDAPEENGPAPLTLSDPSSRRTDRGSSRGDLTHVFNMSFVARPKVSVSNGLLRSLLNNNQLSAIILADSGETFNYTTGDINGDGVTGADRPVGVPRNAGRLPAFLGVDARYSRYITLKRERSLEFYIEASNLFNLQQVSSYQATNLSATGKNPLVDPITGVLLGPTPDTSSLSPLWRESRQVQLGLKLHF